MADEIIVKVRADVDGFKSDMDEAKKIGNAAIQDIEKNDLFAKAANNAKDLKESLKLIAKASGDIRLDNFNVDELVNDTTKLKKLIESLTQSLKGMKVGSNEFNQLDAIIKSANVQLVKLNTTSEATGKSLRTQMREAQAEVAKLSDKFGATSVQAIKAAKHAADLKDRIGDAKSLTDAFNPDAKFNALSSSITGIAGGFSAVQGAMGLLGSESEDVAKTLLKVQSALALSQGLQQLGEAKDSFVQLKAVAVNAFQGIKTAIGGTGIGLLVIGITSAIYAITKYGTAARSAFEKESESLEKINKQHSAKKNLLDYNVQLMKLQGKTEKQILEYKQSQLLIDLKQEDIQIQKMKSKLLEARLENEKFKKFKDKGFSFTGSLFYIDDDELKKIEDRTHEAENNYIKNSTELLSIKNSIRDIDEKNANEANKNSEKELDASLKRKYDLYVKNQKEVEDYLKGLENESKLLGTFSTPEEYEKALKDLEKAKLTELEFAKKTITEEYDIKIKNASKYVDDISALEAKKTAELKAIDDKYRDEEEKAEQKRIQDQRETDRISFRNYNEELEKKKALQRQYFDEILKFAENGILLQIGLNPQDVERVKFTIDEFIKSLKNENASPEERFAKGAEAAQSAYQTVSTAIFNADSQRRQQELASIQSQKDEEIRLAGDNEQKKEVIRQKYALKERELKRKQAEADKRKATFDAVVNTAVAVIKAAPNPILMAITAALGASQIALIQATPIPKFAKGGAVPSSDINGIINGRPHSSGGVLIEAEGSEFLVKRSQAMKSENLGLLEAVNLSDSDRDSYINRHYVIPALKAKETKANESYRHSIIEAENNLIARVSSSTLKSIDKRLIETNQSIKSLNGKNYNW